MGTTEASRGRRSSHCGLSVATTKYMASNTVTTCENKVQIFLMMYSPVLWWVQADGFSVTAPSSFK